MRLKLFFLFTLISLSIAGQSIVSYDVMINYLKKHEGNIPKDEELILCFNVYNVDNIFSEDTIVQNVGVYQFWVDITHTNTYLLLKNRNSYHILDVKNVDKDAIKLAKFLDKNGKVLSREYKLECFKSLFHIAPGNKNGVFLKEKCNWFKKWFVKPDSKNQVKYYLNYKEKH